jgi:hypothetical protein
MQHRGHRVFEHPIDSHRTLHAIEAELNALGATGLRITEREVLAGGLTVSELRSPDYDLRNIRIALDSRPATSRIDYEATAEPKYPARYLIWWLVPVLMALVYCIAVSPLVVLALPIGYLLLRLSHRTFLPLWLEELAYKVETRAKRSPAESGA